MQQLFQALTTHDATRVIALVALIVARVVPIFLIAPFFGGRLIPQTVRIGAALAIAAAVAPALVDSAAPAAATLGPATLAGLILKEALIGLILGFLVALVFFAAESAGRLIDTARGANLAEVLSPGLDERASVSGALLMQLTIVVFLTLDGHHAFLRSLTHSYEVLPITTIPTRATAAAVAQASLAGAGHLLAVALALAAPVLAATFLTDLSLGLMNRVSPQVNVFFPGLPLRALLATFVLLLALVAMMTVVRTEMARALAGLLAVFA